LIEIVDVEEMAEESWGKEGVLPSHDFGL